MRIALDYKDLLKTLNRHKIRYLIVGAYAVIYYTEPRYTKDLDIWVEPKSENAEKVYGALKEFGAPLKDISSQDFANRNLVYQMGIAPIRVDIIMGISGVEFNQAWRHRCVTTFDDIKVNIIGINELIESKKRAGRHMDIADMENLRHRLRLRKRKKK